MEKLKLDYIETKTLIPYANNAKTHPPAQIKKICKSIEEFGFNNPVIIDKNNGIVAGHGRVMAANKLKMDKVPCIRAEHLTEKQKQAYILADNRLAELGDWDMDILKLELQEINYDLDIIGFDGFKVGAHMKGLTDDDAVPETPKKPKSKLGDIYQLGDHRLMCGDSTDEGDVKKLMGEDLADMVFTDPPYNIDYDFSQNGMVQTGQRKARFDKIKNDKMSNDDFNIFINKVFSNLLNFMKSGASYYISAGRESTQTFNRILADLDFHVQSWLIWVKENFNISRLDYHPKHEVITYGWKQGKKHNWFGNRSQTDVLIFERNKDAVHPTQKPVELLQYFLLNSSRKSDIVLDLFLGSGSTLIACEKTNRKCYGMELDPHYVDVIIKRWEDYTGKKAQKIN